MMVERQGWILERQMMGAARSMPIRLPLLRRVPVVPVSSSRVLRRLNSAARLPRPPAH